VPQHRARQLLREQVEYLLHGLHRPGRKPPFSMVKRGRVNFGNSK
jgi:hypothetical protein